MREGGAVAGGAGEGAPVAACGEEQRPLGRRERMRGREVHVSVNRDEERD